MGRYWNSQGPQQEAYDRLARELVPMQGQCQTLEGEFLRAAGKLGHEFYNNGGGNNVSGALMFLRKHFPGFREEWWNELAPYVTGAGGEAPQSVYDCCEEIVDTVVTHVASREGIYLPSPEDMLGLRVERTGMEDEAWGDDAWEDEDIDEEDDLEDALSVR